VQLATVG